jgi:hypothetical protein
MPRRPTRTKEVISPSLIPNKEMLGIRNNGNEIGWNRIRRTCYHFYHGGIRTLRIKRELRNIRWNCCPDNSGHIGNKRGGP